MGKKDRSWVIATSASLLLHGTWLLVMVWAFIFQLAHRGLGGYSYLPPLSVPHDQPIIQRQPDPTFGEIDATGESSPLSASGDTEQQARLADQEQPDLTRNPGNAAMDAALQDPSPAASFSPPSATAEHIPPQLHHSQPPPPLQLAQAQAAQPTPAPPTPTQAKPTEDQAKPTDEHPTLPGQTFTGAASPDALTLQPSHPPHPAAAAQPTPTPTATAQPAQKPTPTPTQVAQAAPPSPASPSPAPPSAQSQAAAASAQSVAGDRQPPADVDSDAFSRIDVQMSRDGTVTACNGRPVKTVKPHLGEGGWADLYALGGPPVTSKVCFDATGTVTRVELLTPTGHQAIDMPIQWCLYQWQFPPLPPDKGKPTPDVAIITFRWE